MPNNQFKKHFFFFGGLTLSSLDPGLRGGLKRWSSLERISDKCNYFFVTPNYTPLVLIWVSIDTRGHNTPPPQESPVHINSK